MPSLIRNIVGSVTENIKEDVNVFKSVESNFGSTDWFIVGSVEVFLINFKKVVASENLNNNSDLGASSNRNNNFKEIYISY
jgi:hypothetical protein